MLTKQDCDCLIDAVEAWISKDLGGELLSAMIGGSMLNSNPIERAKFEAEEKQRRLNQDSARKIRKEKAIVLQAKLLQMRDSISANGMIADALRTD